MNRRKALTEEGKNIAHHEEGLSNREISKRLNRSKDVVRNFLQLKSNYGR